MLRRALLAIPLGMLALGLAGALAFAERSRFEPRPQREMSPFAQRILADGKVTGAEYHRAALETVACLRAEGIEVHGPTREQGAWLWESAIWARPGESEDGVLQRLEGAETRCRRTYLTRVEQRYLWTH